MPTVLADISMSLDGFVTGPGAGPDRGLGDGGRPIHNWVFSEKSAPLGGKTVPARGPRSDIPAYRRPAWRAGQDDRG